MKKLFLSAVIVALCAATAGASVINVKVTTNLPTYTVGDTVKWTISAWTDNTTEGLALLGVTLTDDVTPNPLPVDMNENLTAALTTGFFPNKSLRGDFTVTTTKAFYSTDTGFVLEGAGTPDENGTLADIDIHQAGSRADAALDFGNDGVEHIFAIGSFVAKFAGLHDMDLEVTGANYWPLNTGEAQPFEGQSLTGASYVVNPAAAIPEPATLCLVGLGLAGIAGLRRRMK